MTVAIKGKRRARSTSVTGRHGRRPWIPRWGQIRTYAPQQTLDFLARVLGEEIGRAQGPTMVIENRPGAGSIIGTEAVSHAAPDGNTLLLINTPTFVIICICER
jgi:hypothetical protein